MALNSDPSSSEKMLRSVDAASAYTYPDIALRSDEQLRYYCDSDTNTDGPALPTDSSFTKIEVQFTRSDGSLQAWQDDVSVAVIPEGGCTDAQNAIEHIELNDPGTGGNYSIDNFKVENGACP
jgi:hypothetical protein